MLDNQLEKMGSTKDNSNRHCQIMQEMQYKNPKPLQIKDKDNGRKKVKVITKYFYGIFAPAVRPIKQKYT